MPFWTTILAALRFRAGQPPVFTPPLHVFRAHVDSRARQRMQVNAVTAHRLRRNTGVTHRTHVEAL
jgi:hypothetical protein